MRFKEEQAAELRLWAARKLEQLTETDPDILADYVVALLNRDVHVEELRKNIVSELEDILFGNTTHFVAELFVEATSHLRPVSLAHKTFTATTSRFANRSPFPISQAKSALRNAAPLSSDPPGSRKRNLTQVYCKDDQQSHIGNHRVSKWGRGGGTSAGYGVSRRTWKGRGSPVGKSANMQPVGLSLGKMSFNFRKPPTPPPYMPVFNPTSSAATFMAMFPYLTITMANAPGKLKKQERCDYFDAHGYCMRGDMCQYTHIKHTSDVEEPHEVGGYAIDNGQAAGSIRKKARFTRRLPRTSQPPTKPQPSYIPNDISHMPEEPDEPLTREEPEPDLDAFKVGQNIKQQDHEVRLSTLKKAEEFKARVARQLAEMEKQLITAKTKLLNKPGGDKILAQISVDQEKKRLLGLQSRAAELEKTAIENDIDLDGMSVDDTPAPASLRASSARDNTPNLSDARRYKGFSPTAWLAPSDNLSAAISQWWNADTSQTVLTHDAPSSIPTVLLVQEHVESRPKSLLVSGVSVGLNNGADSMNMVRVAVTGITEYNSIQPQSFYDPVNSADDAHDGLIVTFAECWQAEKVHKRLTMVGGVGKVKYAWYTGPLDASAMGTPNAALEVDSIYGDDSDSEDSDVKIDDVQIKDEDLDVAGEDAWGQIS